MQPPTTSCHVSKAGLAGFRMKLRPAVGATRTGATSAPPNGLMNANVWASTQMLRQSLTRSQVSSDASNPKADNVAPENIYQVSCDDFREPETTRFPGFESCRKCDFECCRLSTPANSLKVAKRTIRWSSALLSEDQFAAPNQESDALPRYPGNAELDRLPAEVAFQ
jgi:hypothetical protein